MTKYIRHAREIRIFNPLLFLQVNLEDDEDDAAEMELPAIPGPSQTNIASRKRPHVIESDDEEELAVPFKIRRVSSLSLSAGRCSFYR